jgi:anti-anti-sigma regulatory factor
VDPKFKYVSSSAIPLDANDGLFLYTDGLVECVDANGVQFGKKRLFELVREIYCDGASQIIAKIFSSVEEFSGHVSLDDDMTTVLVKAQTTQTEPVPSEHKPSQPAVTVASYKHFEVESVAGATLLRLCDNSILNSEVCNELQREFVDFANQAVPKRLLISFREVERLSSEMISSLLRFREAIESKNGSLRLCEISPTIREAFAALNLDGTVFNIEDNVDAAIKSFES